MTRWISAAGALLGALALTGCGGGAGGGQAASAAALSSGSGGPTPVASGTQTSLTASQTASPSVPSPTLPVTAALLDPSYVPSGPSAASWYGRGDDPTTAENEAARELALELAGRGASELALYEHFTQGGPLAIFVSGAGHERDSPARRSGWVAPYASYVQASLGIPAIQVDYQDWAAGNDAQALASYPFSLRTGVSRTHALIEKARSAGISEVRLYGHSKGGDVVQEVAWLHAGDPLLVQAVAMGVPLWSAANPGSDPRYGYGGVFRYGRHGTRDYAGKLVVFVRYSDRSSRGELLPASSFPGPGHEYKHLLGTTGVPERLDAVRFQEPVGFADRTQGQAWDY